jgi:hypothetical protein
MALLRGKAVKAARERRQADDRTLPQLDSLPSIWRISLAFEGAPP